MSKDNLSDRINTLFARERWQQARRLLERARRNDPDNHWLLTQLGVTYYEQRRYKRALGYFQAARRILPSCPLTLWHYAGALDALGKHAEAAKIFRKLLKSNISRAEDPCWESERWTENLKADCLYSLGVCFQKLGKRKKAERCFREYVNLLLSGIEGSYTLEDVERELRVLTRNGQRNGAQLELQKAVKTALNKS